MIVNLRGPSGSGKSTAVREIMSKYRDILDWDMHYVDGRRQPLYYTAEHPTGRKLAVLGHYETECGGCDTIKTPDELFKLMGDLAEQGYDILWEGLLMSMDFKRTQPMSERFPTLVIGLDVDLETCFDSINARRHRRNPNLPPVARKNTTNKWKGTRQTIARLAKAGVPCEWHSRETVVARALEVLTCPT